MLNEKYPRTAPSYLDLHIALRLIRSQNIMIGYRPRPATAGTCTVLDIGARVNSRRC